MIRINQLKLPVEHKPEELKKKAAKALRISPEQVEKLKSAGVPWTGEKSRSFFTAIPLI